LGIPLNVAFALNYGASEMSVTLENLGSLITYKGDDGRDTCLGYLFDFTGHGCFDAAVGKVEVTAEQRDAHNRLLDEAMLKGLDEKCEVGQHGTFYTAKDNGRTVVKTWIGTLVSSAVSINGRSLTFRRAGKVYRGRMSNQHDMFNFRRVA
jgi:hypothetical protein